MPSNPIHAGRGNREGTGRRIQAPLLYTPLQSRVWYRIGTQIDDAEIRDEAWSTKTPQFNPAWKP